MNNKEHIGVLFALASAMLWGIFPIITNIYVHIAPPLFLAGITSILAAIVSAFVMKARKKTHELLIRKAHKPMLWVSIFIVIIPTILFFIGTQHTSGINSSVLMLSEIIFTLVFTPLFGERNSSYKVIGSLTIVGGGALLLVQSGTFSLNFGDILIILSTLTYPLGNFFSKRALYVVSPSVILTVRYAIGGVFITSLSLATETISAAQLIHTETILIMLTIGCVLLPLSKITFYEGLKRLDISKVIALEMTFPFFSIIFLTLAYGMALEWKHAAGIILISIGSYITIKRKSENHDSLKYKISL